MTAKTVAQKARVKPGTTIAVLNPIPDVVESLGLPEPVRRPARTVDSDYSTATELLSSTQAEQSAEWFSTSRYGTRR